jgi:hypothetical protein
MPRKKGSAPLSHGESVGVRGYGLSLGDLTLHPALRADLSLRER